MPDDEILEYMQDLIAGRQPPNLLADQPLDAEDFPILIQIPKYNLLTRALQAKIDLEDFAAGWVPALHFSSTWSSKGRPLICQRMQSANLSPSRWRRLIVSDGGAIRPATRRISSGYTTMTRCSTRRWNSGRLPIECVVYSCEQMS